MIPATSLLPSRVVTRVLVAIALPACLALALPSFGHDQPAEAVPALVSLESVAKAGRARFDALVAGDYTTMSAMLGDDLVYTHSTGAVDTKASYLAPLVSGRTRYVRADASDEHVTLYGTMAVITGVVHVTAHVGGEVRPSHLRYTSVWTVRDGRWQMVAWQATRLP